MGLVLVVRSTLPLATSLPVVADVNVEVARGNKCVTVVGNWIVGVLSLGFLDSFGAKRTGSLWLRFFYGDVDRGCRLSFLFIMLHTFLH